MCVSVTLRGKERGLFFTFSFFFDQQRAAAGYHDDDDDDDTGFLAGDILREGGRLFASTVRLA